MHILRRSLSCRVDSCPVWASRAGWSELTADCLGSQDQRDGAGEFYDVLGWYHEAPCGIPVLLLCLMDMGGVSAPTPPAHPFPREVCCLLPPTVSSLPLPI